MSDRLFFKYEIGSMKTEDESFKSMKYEKNGFGKSEPLPVPIYREKIQKCTKFFLKDKLMYQRFQSLWQCSYQSSDDCKLSDDNEKPYFSFRP